MAALLLFTLFIAAGTGSGCATVATGGYPAPTASSMPSSTTSPEAAPTTSRAAGEGAGLLGKDVPSGLLYPELHGPFPATLTSGSQIIHMKAVRKEITSPPSTTEFWRQPSTGRFRKTVSSAGDARVPAFDSLDVFTGERLQGYDLPALDGYDFSLEAYGASVLEHKVDPFSDSQGEIGGPVEELRQAVEQGLLAETGREQAGGRVVVRYEGRVNDDNPLRRVVLADAATGFPLDDRIYRDDGAVFSCWLADLEVVDSADLDALFHLTFPAAVKIATDDQLPQAPERAEGLEDCLRELQKLSSEVPFPLYWLGESAGGLPLDTVDPGAAGEGLPWDSVMIHYHYRDAALIHPAYVGLAVFDLSLRPDLKKPLEGWKLVRTVAASGYQDRLYSAPDGAGDLFYVALRDGVEIDVYGWSDSAPMTEAELIQAAKGLRAY
jgi:hypothetical protein